MASATAATSGERTSSQVSAGATRRHQVVIVGGGNGGISVAARLLRAGRDLDVAIIEPSETHYYQPLWTLVGGGVVPKEKSARPQADVIPRGATWVRSAVTQFVPEANEVLTEAGERIEYQFLVVAAGIELDWDAVAGLRGNVGRNDVVSNYEYDQCERTWEAIRNFKGGTALFVMPPPPIKCAGAPQKIAYLADEAFRRQGVRDKTRIIYASATAGIFAVEKYAEQLNAVIARKGIETLYQHELVELRADTHEAVFVDHGHDHGQVVLNYDLIHVVPPQRAPAFVRESLLADKGGWLEVDKHTLQHPRYPNVFALGDASSLPTSRTGAAIRKQAPVLVENLLAQLNGKGAETFSSYDGYAACPLVTGYGKLILAEFDYDLRPQETFPFNQAKERWSMYQLKRYVLPALYWRGILKGRA
jgi:sulfide:quinone oxidoreductase